jgi:type IV pilus assembly protein PilA
MRKVFQKQEGFTLIELMIVVAIIGILAAIAIPNFLTYQMKSRQSEAKTNLQAIKTSMVAFEGERGCYIGIAAEGVAVPAGGTKTTPFTWAVGLPPTVPAPAWCTAAFAGVFNDIGFRATGNVNYRYVLGGQTIAVGASYIPTGAVAPQINSCPVAVGPPAPAAIAGNNNFVASAQSNLDGDGNVSTWGVTIDHGAQDCTIGVY